MCILYFETLLTEVNKTESKLQGLVADYQKHARKERFKTVFKISSSRKEKLDSVKKNLLDSLNECERTKQELNHYFDLPSNVLVTLGNPPDQQIRTHQYEQFK